MNSFRSSDDNLATSSSTSLNSRVSPWLTRFVYPLGCYVVMPLYFGRLEVTGRENIPLTEPVIVAPTHRSRWDALIVPYAVGRLVSGRDLRFMVSANEVRGVQGWFIERLGGFPVDTERPAISSIRHSVELLSEGEMVTIFPEGGIIRDERKVNPLKRGVARIALEVESDRPKSGIKILPVAIKYDRLYPNWGTDVTVNIGSPIDVARYSQQSIRKATQALTHDLELRLKELYEETPQLQEMTAV